MQTKHCCYLRRLDTAQWSRTVRPWTWWRVDPGRPKRRRQRRPLRGPSGPARPEATLRKHPRHTASVSSQISPVHAPSKCNRASPASLEDAHSQVPVKLSNLQLYHRSEFSMPSHSHQDFKDRLDVRHTAAYLHSYGINHQLVSQIWALPSPWWQWTASPG